MAELSKPVVAEMPKKDNRKGPEAWRVKWIVFWIRKEHGQPERRHTLIVARHALTREVKYFDPDRVFRERGVGLRGQLRLPFGRW